MRTPLSYSLLLFSLAGSYTPDTLSAQQAAMKMPATGRTQFLAEQCFGKLPRTNVKYSNYRPTGFSPDVYDGCGAQYDLGRGASILVTAIVKKVSGDRDFRSSDSSVVITVKGTKGAAVFADARIDDMVDVIMMPTNDAIFRMEVTPANRVNAQDNFDDTLMLLDAFYRGL